MADAASAQSGPFRCHDHGVVVPLWRPATATYEAFAEHLQRAGDFPTFLPWPLSPGWSIADFGCVAPPGGQARATVTSCVGNSDLDGVVEVTVVSEEAGVGLGSRVAGTTQSDPGLEVRTTRPVVKVRLEGYSVPLWLVSTPPTGHELDRTVFAGEAQGRWLWFVMRPASAALLLHDEWLIADVAGFGPELVEAPFGGSPPVW